MRGEGGTHHVVVARRRQLSHHRLRVGVVGRLEEAKDDIVRPAAFLLAVVFKREGEVVLTRIPIRYESCHIKEDEMK